MGAKHKAMHTKYTIPYLISHKIKMGPQCLRKLKLKFAKDQLYTFKFFSYLLPEFSCCYFVDRINRL